MIKVHEILSSFFGIGFIKKGGGTVAAIATALIWMVAVAVPDTWMVIGSVLVVIVYGIWAGNEVEKKWGKDSSKVVIDEVAGMLVALLFIPVSFVNVLLALGLFRFFDILKPLLIRRLEQMPGGWGVMGDDVLAGIYSNIILHLFLLLHLW
ncbi:phosphatidylglycerophosphatase A family protein [Sediminibacterium salmoneum]|uniref:phosphatidylglycerophosphatase A family protein n=1 Tax=Sediminibacterium salmoneum TaxID=426421 RepID=UPI00047A2421|nr:phosphatidylglycerophosphatase A [Sediminibacterium salmoneum]